MRALGRLTSAFVGASAATALWWASNPIEAAVDEDNDTIVVVGGGVMGSSVAASLAASGQKVVVIDENHLVRSSWGDSRMLQHGYEGVYAKLVKRSAELWKKLQEEDRARLAVHGRAQLFVDIENLELCPSLDHALERQRFHASKGRLGTAILSPAEVGARYNGIQGLPTHMRGFLDDNSLALYAAECLAALESKAERYGAEWYAPEQVTKIDRAQRTVFTAGGHAIRYSHLVLATGPWTNAVLATAGLAQLPLFVSAEQLLYLTPRPGADIESLFSHPGMAAIHGDVFWVDEHGRQRQAFVYAIPHLPGGTPAVKVATHMMGELMDTADFCVKEGSTAAAFAAEVYHRRDSLRRTQPAINELDVYQQTIVSRFVDRHLPELNTQEPMMVCRCLYTSTADGDFVFGFHPDDDRVLLLSGFHGEGFKFAPVIGECVTELLGGTTPSSLCLDLLNKCSPLRFFPEQT